MEGGGGRGMGRGSVGLIVAKSVLFRNEAKL